MEIVFVYKKKDDTKKIKMDPSTEKGWKTLSVLIRQEILIRDGLDIVFGTFNDFNHKWKLSHIKIDGVRYSFSDALNYFKSGDIPLSLPNGRQLIPPRRRLGGM